MDSYSDLPDATSLLNLILPLNLDCILNQPSFRSEDLYSHLKRADLLGLLLSLAPNDISSGIRTLSQWRILPDEERWSEQTIQRLVWDLQYALDQEQPQTGRRIKWISKEYFEELEQEPERPSLPEPSTVAPSIHATSQQSASFRNGCTACRLPRSGPCPNHSQCIPPVLPLPLTSRSNKPLHKPLTNSSSNVSRCNTFSQSAANNSSTFESSLLRQDVTTTGNVDEFKENIPPVPPVSRSTRHTRAQKRVVAPIAAQVPISRSPSAVPIMKKSKMTKKTAPVPQFMPSRRSGKTTQKPTTFSNFVSTRHSLSQKRVHSSSPSSTLCAPVNGPIHSDDFKENMSSVPPVPSRRSTKPTLNVRKQNPQAITAHASTSVLPTMKDVNSCVRTVLGQRNGP